MSGTMHRITAWLDPDAKAAIVVVCCNACGYDIEGGHHPACADKQAATTRKVLEVPDCETNGDWLAKVVSEQNAKGRKAVLIISEESARYEGRLVEPGLKAVALTA